MIHTKAIGVVGLVFATLLIRFLANFSISSVREETRMVYWSPETVCFERPAYIYNDRVAIRAELFCYPTS